MRIAVCDDDLREQERLDEAIQGWDPTHAAEKFFNGSSLLEAAKRAPAFDIVFLDIYMPDENGVDIAKALKKYLLRRRSCLLPQARITPCPPLWAGTSAPSF